jgi:Asp-tRNA(Asn)/Glu-tRNA(Gln) amidotransferase C subunit
MAKLATLGLSEEQVEAVATMLTQVEDATEETVSARFEAVIEDGREKGRERWRRWDEKRRSNVGKREQTLANTSRQLARTDDLTSKTQIEPLKEEKSARRATRLPETWTLPIEWREDARAAGIPDHLIDGLALDMRDWSLSSPNGAKRDWRATWRTWVRRKAGDLAKQPRAGPVSVLKDTPANAARRRLENIQNGRRNGSETDDYQPAAGSISGNLVRLVG